MKKRILLIEDRPIRQTNFMKGLGFDLKTSPSFTNACGGADSNFFLESIEKNNFSCFDNYDVIMVHRSALTSETQEVLRNVIQKQSKTLVLFSGGISTVSLIELGGGTMLTINSADFYSESLISYLNDTEDNILKLAFGENWEVNIIASLLEKLSFYLINYEDKPFDLIYSDLGLNRFIVDKFFPADKKGIIKKEDFDKIKDNVRKKLKEII